MIHTGPTRISVEVNGGKKLRTGNFTRHEKIRKFED
jgi:hypothetical protein